MAKRNDAEKTGVKNRSDFHPAEESTRHTKPEPSGAIAQETEAHELREGSGNLSNLTTEDLRQRAKSLAIDEWDSADREDLILALKDYQEKELRPRQTFESA